VDTSGLPASRTLEVIFLNVPGRVPVDSNRFQWVPVPENKCYICADSVSGAKATKVITACQKPC
jgi:hypothetical protein